MPGLPSGKMQLSINPEIAMYRAARRSVLMGLGLLTALIGVSTSHAQTVTYNRVSDLNFPPGNNWAVWVTGSTLFNPTPGPEGEFSVLVTNAITGNSVPGVPVTVIINDPSIRLIKGEITWQDGIFTRTVCQELDWLQGESATATSGLDGRAYFRLVGHAIESAGCPREYESRIRADWAPGVVLSNPANLIGVTLACFDHDGQGVGANDLSLWLTDFGCGSVSHADYDGDGSVGSNDLSIWLDVFGDGSSVWMPTSYFPCIFF